MDPTELSGFWAGSGLVWISRGGLAFWMALQPSPNAEMDLQHAVGSKIWRERLRTGLGSKEKAAPQLPHIIPQKLPWSQTFILMLTVTWLFPWKGLFRQLPTSRIESLGISPLELPTCYFI